MNQPYFINPFWSFVAQPHFFPLLPMQSYENFVFPKKIQTSDDSFGNVTKQKKIREFQKQEEQSEKKIQDRRKTIKKTKQDKNFSYRYQDKDRNIYSNILKGFILKIRQDMKFQSQCESLMRSMKVSFDFEDLVEFIDGNFKKSKTYISPSFMRKVLESNLESEMGKYFKILLSRYLKQGFTLVLLASQRIQKHSKLLQMKKARQLYNLVYEAGEWSGEEVNNMEE